jgi:predicted dehydrogenase
MALLPDVLPSPRTPDPLAAPVLRWGLMGTGWIIDRFVGAVQRNTRQEFVAIASRDQARATTVAARLGIPRAYGSYQELAADPSVEVVYVGTGHLDHLACARTALDAGKHVLVEKPLAPSAVQAAELADLAAARGVFCAEALWSFFLPRYDVVRQILDDGVLGEVHTVLADNGEWLPPGHRIFDVDRAGGPMLDLGTYPFSLATWVLDDPAVLAADAQPHPGGVHGQLAAVLADRAGRQAVLHTTILGDTPTQASISGSLGTLWLPGPFYQPGDVVVRPAGGGDARSFTEPAVGHEGMYFEAAEVARCVSSGLRETPLRPLADSVATLHAMDAARARCGIAYPGE